MKINNVNPFLVRAENLMRTNKQELAYLEYQKILKKDKKHFLANANSAIILYNKTDYSGALKHFEIIADKIYTNDEILLKFNECLVHLERYDAALNLLNKALIHSNNPKFLSEIAAIYSKKNQNVEALDYALKAIQLAPSNSLGFLQLGGILFDLLRYDDAIISFRTALDLDPSNSTARFNLASCYSSLGMYKDAINEYTLCRSTPNLSPSSLKQINFFLSHIYLKMGDLNNGWKLYEDGFINNSHSSRHPFRRFNVPKWDGRPILGKKLLIWKEQGLGDMFMFMSCFDKVRDLCDDIIIECDYRAVSLFQRAFPYCTVRRESYTSDFSTKFDDFDFHLPMGSLMSLFRNEISDFNDSKPYLTPLSEYKSLFSNRMYDNDGKLKIGLCWRSGLTNTLRNSNYLPISEFFPILSRKDCTFFNLQYGDCTDELNTLSKDFGLLLNNWPDIDQKNNLEAVAALISELDLVITAGTAVAQIAAAVGTKVILFSPSESWVFLGQDEYPWYKNVKSFKFKTEAEKYDIPNKINHFISSNFDQLILDSFIGENSFQITQY